MRKEEARERAEDWLRHLQQTARTLLQAEEGLKNSVSELLREHALSPHDLKQRLDELLGGSQADTLWQRLRLDDAASTFAQYRSEFERRAAEGMHKLREALHLASAEEVEQLNKEITHLNRKLADMAKKLKRNAPREK